MIVQVYGRKITDNLRKGTELHLHLPGPPRGVWNINGIAASGGEIILCKSLIDAMSFWCAGHQNVTAAYGHDGMTADHIDAFKRCRVERVMIAYDRNNEGERAAEEVSAQADRGGDGDLSNRISQDHGRQSLRLEGEAGGEVAGHAHPQGVMAGAWTTRRQRERGAGAARRNARGQRKRRHRQRRRDRPSSTRAPMNPPQKRHAPSKRTPRLRSKMTSGADAAAASSAHAAAAQTASGGENETGVTGRARTAVCIGAGWADRLCAAREGRTRTTRRAVARIAAAGGTQQDTPQSESDTEIVLVFADRRYRVRGWKKPLAVDTMKVNLLVSRVEDEGKRPSPKMGDRAGASMSIRSTSTTPKPAPLT